MGAEMEIRINYTGRPTGYKKRRYLHRLSKRIDKEVAESVLDLSSGAWYNMYHRHLDWDNLGQESQKWRRFFAGRFYQLMKNYDDQLSYSNFEAQLWMMFDLDESGNDAVFVNTPNPHSVFPIKIKIEECLDPKQVLQELRCDWHMCYYLTTDRKILCEFPKQAKSGISIDSTNCSNHGC